ncbi:hypothetical protein SAMN05421853_11097 [Roseivivax halotolerans]|uniref:Uncharacterized protein n=1 Tax=Roseivivax halotolerans TaxID=93684 RepID=A0A1I5ZJC0_9RHOB|nr:hypothetical protein [Roseivivax halotolerans]SFQ56545.1 hypothetical protein SAMN05421853_11097 [Roseivivax halotolerans]
MNVFNFDDSDRETALILLTDLMSRTALRWETVGRRRELNRLALKVADLTGESEAA